mmetsp:Transcript_5062/g.14395  ORF Transcript_5062/g.14395 Transcript_5062/m.14395 type:complete len:373 (-) Transcript_5062:271-1389(-)
MSTMKAWVSHGFNLIPEQAVKSLSYETVPVPTPEAGQVLVRVHYASVDPMDWKLLSGEFRDLFPKCKLRFVPGLDVAGEVVEVGPGCERLQEGDRVVCCLGFESFREQATFGPAGAFAELCVCPEGHAARVPESINIPSEASLLKVAGLPLAGLTAYQALLTGGGCSTRGEPLGAITRGSKVLVLGGNRGVGHLAVQIARLKGATVATTVPPTSVEWIKDLGASEVINFNEEDWIQRMTPTVGCSGMDIILDCVGWATSLSELDRAMYVLRPGGQYISSFHHEVFDILDDTDGERKGRKFSAMMPKAVAEDLDVLVNWVLTGKLEVVVDQVCPFDQARHALHESVVGQCRGKVVLCQCAAHSAGETGAVGGA